MNTNHDPAPSGAAPSGLATYLGAALEATPRNLRSAMTALAKLGETGWRPIGGYPGSDTHWQVGCLVCTDGGRLVWRGPKFFSHLRRDKPVGRHPGCLEKDERARRLKELAAELQPVCPCPQDHPTTPEAVSEAMRAVAKARQDGSPDAELAAVALLLGPCPASRARAEAARLVPTDL